jgi:hypothetical protein
LRLGFHGSPCYQTQRVAQARGSRHAGRTDSSPGPGRTYTSSCGGPKQRSGRSLRPQLPGRPLKRRRPTSPWIEEDPCGSSMDRRFRM